MSKKISAAVLILFGVFIIAKIVFQISTTLNSGRRLDQAVNDLTTLQEENQKLKSELTYAESYDYLEKTARDELNLAKPDETVVIIPGQVITQVENRGKKPVVPQVPNWKRWLNLLFH